MSFLAILALGVVCLVTFAIGSGTNDAAKVAAFVFIASALALYAAPSLVAASRKHRNTTGIVVLNILGGWTVLGWIVALVWAYAAQSPETVTALAPDPDDQMKACAFCAENIKAAAKVCRYCGSAVATA